MRLLYSSSRLLRCPFLHTAGLGHEGYRSASRTYALSEHVHSITFEVPLMDTLSRSGGELYQDPGVDRLRRQILRLQVHVHQTASNIILRRLRAVQRRMHYEKVLQRTRDSLGRQSLHEKLVCDYVESPSVE